MATLTTVTSDLRTELKDASSAVWSDAELQRAIAKALQELSRYMPLQRKNTLTTTAGSRDISLTILTDRIRVRAVEYPTGNYPATFVGFSVWVDTLTMLTDAAPAGVENVNVYWESPRHLDAGGTSLDIGQIELLLLGAAGYACKQEHVDSTDTLTTGGQQTPRNWEALADRYLERFYQLLRKRQGVRVRRLYVPEEPDEDQNTDPGP